MHAISCSLFYGKIHRRDGKNPLTSMIKLNVFHILNDGLGCNSQLIDANILDCLITPLSFFNGENIHRICSNCIYWLTRLSENCKILLKSVKFSLTFCLYT